MDYQKLIDGLEDVADAIVSDVGYQGLIKPIADAQIAIAALRDISEALNNSFNHSSAWSRIIEIVSDFEEEMKFNDQC